MKTSGGRKRTTISDLLSQLDPGPTRWNQAAVLRLNSLVPFLIAGAFACGPAARTTVEDVAPDRIPVQSDVILKATVDSCSNPCLTYGTPECSVDIDVEAREISITACVPVEEEIADCTPLCGPELIAECAVGPLPEGQYVVKSGGFSETITVRNN